MSAVPKAAFAAALVMGSIAGFSHASDDEDDRGRGSRRPDSELSAGRINRPVVLVDSTGRVIGRVAPGAQGGSAVVLDFRNDTLVVPLTLASSSQNTGLDWGRGYIYYANPNCQPPAYIPSVFGAGGTRSVAPERRGNQWVLLVGAGRNPQQIPGASVRSISSGGLNCFNTSGFESPQDVYPVQQVLPLDPVGIAPFFYR